MLCLCWYGRFSHFRSCLLLALNFFLFFSLSHKWFSWKLFFVCLFQHIQWNRCKIHLFAFLVVRQCRYLYVSVPVIWCSYASIYLTNPQSDHFKQSTEIRYWYLLKILHIHIDTNALVCRHTLNEIDFASDAMAERRSVAYYPIISIYTHRYKYVHVHAFHHFTFKNSIYGRVREFSEAKKGLYG